MKAEHFELLVEEPSMELFLRSILPRLLGDKATHTIHTHQGKKDLLGKLGGRLRGYARWLPESSRIIVLIDRDNSDCAALKKEMEECATNAGLTTRATVKSSQWQVATRLAIEELEAWYFGEWDAVRKAYPKLRSTVPSQAPYRNSDTIAGGTWEALERIMQNAGYFPGA